MTKNTNTKLTAEVPDYEASTKVYPQHGMRYPDGTIKWGQDHAAGVSFESLARGDRWSTEAWEKRVKARAVEACVDPDEYAAGHQPVKRTVILAVTEVA